MTSSGHYDFNFLYDVKTLQTDRVELRPLVPALHAQVLHDNFARYPETQDYLHMKTTSLEETFLQYAIYTRLPQDGEGTTPDDYAFAGIISCGYVSPDNLHAELATVVVFPPFQRTHVLTHAAGALIHHILDMPADGGLGLRRCVWTATTVNPNSIKAGLRLGFTYEGTIRNEQVLPPGKTGVRDGRPGDAKPGHMSRDTWFGSITWQDWENGAKDKLDKLIARNDQAKKE